VAIFRDITIFDQPLGVFVVQVWIGLQFFLVFCSLKMTVLNGEGGKVSERSEAKRASLLEDEHTREELQT